MEKPAERPLGGGLIAAMVDKFALEIFRENFNKATIEKLLKDQVLQCISRLVVSQVNELLRLKDTSSHWDREKKMMECIDRYIAEKHNGSLDALIDNQITMYLASDHKGKIIHGLKASIDRLVESRLKYSIERQIEEKVLAAINKELEDYGEVIVEKFTGAR